MREYSNHKRIFSCNPHQTLPYRCRFTQDIASLLKKKMNKIVYNSKTYVYTQTPIWIPAQPVWWAKKERYSEVIWG